MKTNPLLILAMLISTYALHAQQTNTPATVKIKTMTDVNGIQTVKDTSFVLNSSGELNKNIQVIVPGAGMVTEGTSINIDSILKVQGIVLPEGGTPMKAKTQSRNITVVAEDKTLHIDLNIDSLAGIANGPVIGESYVVEKAPCGSDQKTVTTSKQVIMIVIKRRIDIEEPSEAEKQTLAKQNGTSYQALSVERLELFPNPNNGHFQLSFSMDKKADTDIAVQNPEGKTVYSEKLPAFSGQYKKEIDLSHQPKGIYFLKIMRGSSAQIKKLVVE